MTKRANRTRHSGFSLLELMVVITVAAILLAIGVPNLVTVIRNNRMLATANDFVSAVHAARSEAIKRRTNVTLCASSDADEVVPACSHDFSAGWIAFADRNGNGTVDPDANPLLDDTVLVARRLTPGHFEIRGNGGNYIALAPSGFVRSLPALGGRATSLTICDDRGNIETSQGQSAARVIVLGGTGRPEVLKSPDEVNAFGGC